MDIAIDAGPGVLQLRVGALIVEDGATLLAGAAEDPYLWTVGGRVQLGESTEDAVLRECREETGVDWCVDRLVGVVEGFYRPVSAGLGMASACYHELGFYYAVHRDRSAPINVTSGEDFGQQTLRWVPLDELEASPHFPRALVRLLACPAPDVMHIVDREDSAPPGPWS
ncbi:MAG: NUDIX domain-containing protein [Propionibacteriaceae bacterium]|nr:NUDIX domain-containing protein [Propionibacteriaceae bacterium]